MVNKELVLIARSTGGLGPNKVAFLSVIFIFLTFTEVNGIVVVILPSRWLGNMVYSRMKCTHRVSYKVFVMSITFMRSAGPMF